MTTAHISNNPRVLKEADALSEAGHDVRVVAYDSDAAAAQRDDALMASRSWRLTRVVVRRAGARATARWALAGARHRVAGALFSRGARQPAIRDAAISKHLWRMSSAARAEPCDVMVAHHAPALPAAARAARQLGASLAFDFEDLHVGDVSNDESGRRQALLIGDVDSALLPRCAVLIASSAPIADAISARYRVPRPTVVLNTFPQGSLGVPCDADRVGPAPSFYWFSQVVGPRRGLEEIVAAAARSQVPLQLHLRGAPYEDFADRLRAIASENGMIGTLHLHPLAPPEQLVGLSASHDVGLALEEPWNENRRLCVSNKLLTYLVAGNAVLASDTPGQRSVLDDAPGAAAVYAPGDLDGLTSIVRRLATDPAALASARRAAACAAARRFSWEHDAPTLVAALEGAAA
ncbi:MAG TPA: glycosyltransferase [Gemmatimonadaceae bacterium]|nr:glycosyltransferase [Gemmatimonadaceae bacterium]